MTKEYLEEEKTCVLCLGKFTGWGNNPAPLEHDGECCDECNSQHVIPVRIMMEKVRRWQLADEAKKARSA